MRRCLGFVLFALSVVAAAQAPWPLERQDRWGTARAVFGPDPASLTTPWVFAKLTSQPVSHGPSLGPGGVGFFGDWVENKVFKFDYNTAAILGSFQADNFVTSVPAITASPIVIVGTDGASAHMFGVDTSIMDFNWFLTTGYLGGSPNIGPEGDVAIATGSGVAYRLNPVNGQIHWSHSGMASATGAAVFTRDDTKVIIPNGSSVTALNWSDGTTAWSVNYGAPMNKAAVAPNGTIVVGSDSGTIYGLSPANGAVLWTWNTLSWVRGAAAFSPDGSVAYVPSYDNRIYAIRVSDGARLWTYTTSLWCEVGPVVGFDGSVYEHNKAGDLYRIRPDGSLAWQVHLNGEARGPMTIGPDGTLYVGYTGESSKGLAIIRQQPIQLAADALSMDRGSVVSGGLSSTFQSDDSYVTFIKGLVLNSSESPVRAILTTHVTFHPVSQIVLNVEAHATLSGITRFVEMWNFSSSTWEGVGQMAESQTDTNSAITLTNAGRFADSNGMIKVRIGWKPLGPLASSSWSILLDYVHFTVVPAFVAP